LADEYLFILFILIKGIVVAQSSSFKRRPPAGSVNKDFGRPADEKATEDEDDETSDQCPEPNGFFADAEQCDKYYHCS